MEVISAPFIVNPNSFLYNNCNVNKIKTFKTQIIF